MSEPNVDELVIAIRKFFLDNGKWEVDDDSWLWISDANYGFDPRDLAEKMALTSALAAKDREIAALREALKAAAIVARTTPLQTDQSGWYSDGFRDARNYIADRLDDIIRLAFAASPAPDPAEAMRDHAEFAHDPFDMPSAPQSGDKEPSELATALTFHPDFDDPLDLARWIDGKLADHPAEAMRAKCEKIVAEAGPCA